MAGNSSLNAAAKAKKDEFYTQLPDIEQELRHYRKHFKGKTVFCNCDDPFESNFFKYFVLNFNKLGLKKVIATCYRGSPIAGQQLSMFDEVTETEQPANTPYKAVVTQVYDALGDGGVDMLDVAELFRNGVNELTELKGDGDFRSPECLALLDEADIVCTNPPFSLFREFVATLVEHGKHFLIIGNKNAITYKEIFPLLANNQMWVGCRGFAGGMWFYANYEGKTEKIVNGQRIINVPSIWFTNLDHKKRHEEIVLVKKYNPMLYPKYANYDAIEVSKTSEIPYDYDGEMGVPITFLDRYNPEQFEIIGSSRWLGRPMSEIAKKGEYVSGGIRFYIDTLAKSESANIIAETADSGQRTADSGQRTADSGQRTADSGQFRYRCLYDRIVIKLRKIPETI